MKSTHAHQVGGKHYVQYKIQPWDIIEEYGLDFFEGSALKYLLRRKHNRVEDLRKCRHYIDKIIERATKGGDSMAAKPTKGGKKCA